MKIAARKAVTAPNKNGAEGPKPLHFPTPCHKMPAIREAGKSKIPKIPL